MTIYWATKLRGFLKHISEGQGNVRFLQKEFYETSSKLHILKSKLIRSRLFDLSGTFQVVSVANKNCDAYGSYNRFLDADKPYFIYLENPTALYHYAPRRLKYFTGRERFRGCLEDKNLKYIVCMSEACRTTFDKINMPLCEHVKMKTIYPLVPQNAYANAERIEKKCYAETLECLYCVQGKRFYTKGGRDILTAFENLCADGKRLHLTVITNIDALDKETLELIDKSENISLYGFGFPYSEMEKIYANTAVLIHPSSDDSFGLTVLEAIKGGCAVLGSRLYAIPEMVEEHKNGILIDPLYRSFTEDNIPNPEAWGYKKKLKLSKEIDPKYIGDIESALKAMYENRDMLFSFAKRSLELANTKFGEENIRGQWEEVWTSLEEKNTDEA